jgi:tetratricopeptide (TPR) repeat protein
VTPAWRALEAAGQAETIERLDVRLGLPYMVEFDLRFFSGLRHHELQAAAVQLGPAAQRGSPRALARLGRTRRLSGDVAGARADLDQALSLDPGLYEAKLWRAELDMPSRHGEAELAACAEARPGDASAAAWLAFSRLLRGDHRAAASGLSKAPRDSALCALLRGVALERCAQKSAAAACYRRAARLEPSCSAAHWLLSRAAKGAASLRAAHGALQAQPGYSFLAQFMRQEERSWPATIARLRRFAFEFPDKVRWYDRQDDLLYSPFHEREFQDALALKNAHGRRAWTSAMAGRAALRCPPASATRSRGEFFMRDAARLGPSHGWIIAWRGLAKLSRGDRHGALKDFDRALALQPWYHRAYAWRGALLIGMGRAKEAAADLDRSVAIDDGYPFAYHQRSLARRATGDFLGGAEDLERAFEGDHRYDWTFTSGREPRKEDDRKALAELNAAVRRHPRSAALRAWRGVLLLKNSRTAAHALLELERAVVLDPGSALAQGLLGKALLSLGEAARAARHLLRARELRPGVETYALWLAEAEHASGEKAKAMARLESVVPGRRGYNMLFTRARLKLQGGDARAALLDIARCVHIRGRSADAYHLRALAQLSLGRWKAARQSADVALYASPHHGPARLARAEALRREGRHALAIKEYGEISRRHPYLFNEEQRQKWNRLLAA